MFGANLFANLDEMVAIILFGIGFTTLLFNRNIIKKSSGSISWTRQCSFPGLYGLYRGRAAPIVVDGVTSAEAYINPIPSGLVLTGIVVSVSVTAMMLALSIRLYRRYHTLYLDEIYMFAQKEDK